MSTADQPKGTPSAAESPSDAPQPTPDGATDDDASSDQTDDASDNPAGDASTTDGESSDSATDDSDDCAEIPTYVHARLVAEIKLILELPTAPDPGQPPHRFTLSNGGGSYSKTLSFPSDAQPGETQGMSELVFDGLTDGHTYSLQGEGEDGTYDLFDPMFYHAIVPTLAGQDPSSPSTGPSTDDAPADGDPDNTDAS